MSELDLSIVVPVFNEAENLPALHQEIAASLTPTGLDFEVLYVDDGSTDGSAAVLAELAATDSRIGLLRLRHNCGQTAGLAAGFRAARGRVIGTLDAADIVCGIRTERHDSWLRRWSSRIANAVRNRLTAESVTDVGCSLRVFRAHLVRDLPLFTGMHRFLPTLLRLQGGSLREIPVRHRPRLHGTSKYGIHDRLWVGIVDLLAVRWMQRRWIDRRLVEPAEESEAPAERSSA